MWSRNGKPHYVDLIRHSQNCWLNTTKNWDHILLLMMKRYLWVEYMPLTLKMIAKKTVNRDVAWMHEIQAHALIHSPPIKVNHETPLLNAAALLLRHDLNQLPVTTTKMFVGYSNATITNFCLVIYSNKETFNSALLGVSDATKQPILWPNSPSNSPSRFPQSDIVHIEWMLCVKSPPLEEMDSMKLPALREWIGGHTLPDGSKDKWYHQPRPMCSNVVNRRVI